VKFKSSGNRLRYYALVCSRAKRASTASGRAAAMLIAVGNPRSQDSGKCFRNNNDPTKIPLGVVQNVLARMNSSNGEVVSPITRRPQVNILQRLDESQVGSVLIDLAYSCVKRPSSSPRQAGASRET